MRSLILRTSDEVRAAAEKRLGYAVEDLAWNYCVEMEWVDYVLRAPYTSEPREEFQETFDDLVTNLRRIARYFPGAGAASGLRAAAGSAEPSAGLAQAQIGRVDPRLSALSRLAAVEARQEPEVVAFRREVLRGRLILAADIAAWVEHRAVPAGRVVASPVWLSYPGPKHVQSVRVPPRSALARLRALATELVSLYGWTEPATVAFVLADYSPRPTVASTGIRAGRTELTTRVKIEVHPSVTARDVARLYEDIRAQFLGPGRRGHLHPRADGRRSWAVLATFIAGANDGRIWSEALAAWNREQRPRRPGWCYVEGRNPEGQLGTFIRDARAAYHQLTGEALAWKSAGQRRKRRSTEPRAHKLHTIRGRRAGRSS